MKLRESEQVMRVPGHLLFVLCDEQKCKRDPNRCTHLFTPHEQMVISKIIQNYRGINIREAFFAPLHCGKQHPAHSYKFQSNYSRPSIDTARRVFKVGACGTMQGWTPSGLSPISRSQIRQSTRCEDRVAPTHALSP